ncbi:DUF1963 domain-containing protein [Actinomadura verrucosospora]|uniref:DUF1963 domain-containing protein n=1 Tax=Actinomadura verrucosospora TaxID=46165 RepID=A0A7D3ZYF0_ACTVE|nr:DUF1963 domain-containing protein [Actinomadura verrucosospora]QKG23086.1 hypothetical protein ACTIVE_4727 [Actinomadura verrucosospora]
MKFDDPGTVLPVCVERLGETAGRQFAGMARRGFHLQRPAGGTRPTGRCRLGGPALLDPGTSWPETGGYPYSLFAVIDTDALAGWLGAELPVRPGLLNFFYFDPDVPYEVYRELDFAHGTGLVIPADPARAVEMQAPAPARSFPSTPVHAAETVMLPDCWDVEDGDIDYDEDEHWGATSLLLQRMDGLAGTTGLHCAFGWPDTSYTIPVTERDADGVPDVHLLQLAEDAELGWGWGDAGTLYFTIPAKAFAQRDFTQAKVEGQCC